MRVRGLAPVLLFVVGGCQDYLFDQVCPEAVRESQIVVPAATPTPADILFVVDNSGSMADEQENLAVNFDRFINEIAGAGDYHIAVVTTDLQSSGGEKEGLANFIFSAQDPNILTEYDPTGCREITPSIEHGCFRGPDAATRIIKSNTLEPAQQITTFANNVRVGSCGSGNETGLAAMIAALEKTQGNGCNAGFLRDNANLVIIIVSDEEDDDNTPVQQYVNDLKPFKNGSASKIRVATIVSTVDGSPADCNIANGGQCGGNCNNPPPAGSGNACMTNQNNCPNGEFCSAAGGQMNGTCDNELNRYWTFCDWCSYYNTADCCSAKAGSRYVQFARMIEQEVANVDPAVEVSSCLGATQEGARDACKIDTICQNNFGDTLAQIARDLVIPNTYNLDPPAAYPPGVSVRVKNGRFPAEGLKLVYEEDFEVTSDGGQLVFTGPNSPREGEDIEINFVVEKENLNTEPRGACQ